MKYLVTHTTRYSYEDFVSYCHNIATLKPREYYGQDLLDFKIDIHPLPSEISEQKDFFGNNLTRFSIMHQHRILKVTSQLNIERNCDNLPELYSSEYCRNVTIEEAIQELQKTDEGTLHARQFLLESPLIRKVSKEIREYANVSFRSDRSVYDAAYELMQRIYNDFKFVAGFTNVATPLNTVILEKKGVCQDFAQIAIACIRCAGLPAKYISGYIETVAPPGTEKMVGTDASHAWFSVYIPGFGWVEFDPTNNQVPSNQHIVVAWGRDYYDVAPLKGVIYSNGENSMDVSVDVRRIEN